MRGTHRGPRLSPWGRLVAASAALVVGSAIALVSWAFATREERVTSYSVQGAVTAVDLDLGDADVTVARSRDDGTVRVELDDHSTFRHGVSTTRALTVRTLRIRSRCPKSIPDSCSADYRLEVPDNVLVNVATGGGKVSLRGYRGRAVIATRSGDIDVRGFCGFLLQATAQSGDVDAETSCAPERLTMRSSSGSVHAQVPPGRYRLDAESASGRRVIRGVTPEADAPYAIQAFSSSGDVTWSGARDRRAPPPRPPGARGPGRRVPRGGRPDRGARRGRRVRPRGRGAR